MAGKQCSKSMVACHVLRLAQHEVVVLIVAWTRARLYGTCKTVLSIAHDVGCRS